MKITDCDISRRAQVALYKRGFTTVEKLKNSDINYVLFDSLKCEPMNLVNEITNLVSVVQSGKVPNSIKGSNIAKDIGHDFPKNLYDSMVEELLKDNHPALKKLPFSDKNCTGNVLKFIDSFVMFSNRILSDKDRELLIHRYVLLYTYLDVAKRMGISESTAYKTLGKRLKVIYDKIAKRLCLTYGSKDIEDTDISPKVKRVLNKVGIKTTTELLNADLPKVLAPYNLDKKLLSEVSDCVKAVSGGTKIVSFNKKNLEEKYPNNIYEYILKNSDKDTLNERPFSDKEAYSNMVYALLGLFMDSEESFLTPRDKKFILMFFKENKSIEVISRVYNISKVRADNLLSGALNKIVQKLYALYSSKDSIVYANLDKSIVLTLIEKGIYYKSECFDLLNNLKAYKKFIQQYDFLLGLNIDPESVCDVFSTSLDKYDLSVRSYNNLVRAGIKTVGDLLNKSNDELANVRYIGKSGLNEVLSLKNKLLQNT